jgi:hypothetical protein
MQQPPHVAESAADEPFLTGYDMAILLRICGCWTPTQKARLGRRLLELC